VIIDGRIADVCETEFLDGTFIIPSSSCRSCSTSPTPRIRSSAPGAGGGLDILHRIQKMGHMEVRITDDDFPKIREVDSKLIALAKRMGAKVITNDFKPEQGRRTAGRHGSEHQRPVERREARGAAG